MVTTKAEETYAALGAKLERGMRLSEAVRELASESGRSEAAIRASYYNQRTKLGQHGRRPDRAAEGLSVKDALHKARQLLEQALAQIDEELGLAEAEMRAARERYEQLKAQASERKAELKRKIAVL